MKLLLNLVLGFARASGLDPHAAHLPLSQVHRELLEAAEFAGYGAADNSAIIKAYD
jgi:3-hydroxyisobutyrate dehydrogenase-like beta-hydroxyacid dehydrogenase